MVSLGLASIPSNFLLAASELSPPVSRQQPQVGALAQKPPSHFPLADGIYLYGQSSQPEQLGQEYLVFKIHRGRAIGAFYMPRSEFNCFFGSLDSGYLRLSVVDPYDRSVSPYAIRLQDLSPRAANGPVSGTVGLEGYYPIQEIGTNDRRILNVCLEEHQ